MRLLTFQIKKAAGFTMIELVMVLVIIALLSAIALPRFAKLGSQAEISSNQSVAGQLRAAVNIAHTQWIASGAIASGSTITLENQGIHLNPKGWPNGGAGGVSGTAVGIDHCYIIFSTLLQNPPQSSNDSTVLSDTPAYYVTASGSTCTFQLYANGRAAASNSSITYDVSNGLVLAN